MVFRRLLTIFSAVFLFSSSLVFPASTEAVVKLQLQYLAKNLTQNPTSSSPMSISPKTALERLFTSQKLKSDWFAPSFHSEIPFKQIQPIITDIKNNLGTYQEIQQNDNGYSVVLTKGSVPTKIVLNSKGQITGLLFQSPNLKLSSLEEATAQL